MIGSGQARIVNDAYFTIEPWITKVLAKELKRYDLAAVWEPAAGAGHMVDVLLDYSPVYATDLNEYPHFKGCSDYSFEQHDFLKPEAFDAKLSELAHGGFPLEGIITNPPYQKGVCEAFVRQAVAYLDRPGSTIQVVAMLLRHEWDAAAGRADLFRNNIHFTQKIVLTSRPRWIMNTEGSPRFSYAWYVWSRHHHGAPTIIWRGKLDAAD